MIYYLLGAIVLLLVGHVFKARRWRLFVSVYEAVPPSRLISSLAAGYLLNFYLPLHLGDFFRIWFVGRKMRNGLGYATSTVILDRFLDLLVVAVLFGCMAVFAPAAEITAAAVQYLLLVLALALLLAAARFHTRTFKHTAQAVCSVCNDRIRFRLLFFLWALITSFKDLFRKVKLGRLLLDTLLMWAAYLASYWLVAQMLTAAAQSTSFEDMLLMIFSSGAIFRSTFYITGDTLQAGAQLLLSIYLLSPLVVLLLYSLASMRSHKSDVQPTSKLLPQLKSEEQLQFLDSYFSGDARQALHEYLSMNADVGILRDYSSGSDATTMLCIRGDATIFRKYAIGSAASKLTAQADWLRKQAAALPLPVITLEKQGTNSYCYDMRYDSEGIGMFQYIYSHAIEASWEILSRLLDDLSRTLYAAPLPPVTQANARTYVEQKVMDNLKLIRQSRVLHELTSRDYLTINGVRKRNLPMLLPMLDAAHLSELFTGEAECDIHGDLTLENIICYVSGEHDSPYYLIDPNPGNPIRTQSLDLAKLFQSLHGKYEFLSQDSPARVHEDCIDFLLPQTRQFETIFELLRSRLQERLGEEGLRRVYYHELVHWLRLLPYRLRRSEATAPRYYAAMILVMNDVYDLYEEQS